MKRNFSLFILFLSLLFLGNCRSQSSSANASVHSTPTSSKEITDHTLADFYVAFGSVCCGPTSYQPWLNYTLNFTMEQNIHFNMIEKVTGMGREGEYMLLLFAYDWTENQKQEYFNGLQNIQWEDQDSNSFGGIKVGTNLATKDIHNSERFEIESVKLEDL